MDFIVKAFLAYLASHPDVVERLVAALVDAIVDHLKNPNPNPSA